MCEVEQYQLDIVGLSLHIAGAPEVLEGELDSPFLKLLRMRGDRKVQGYSQPMAEHQCVGVLPSERKGHLYVAESHLGGRC